MQNVITVPVPVPGNTNQPGILQAHRRRSLSSQSHVTFNLPLNFLPELKTINYISFFVLALHQPAG